MMSLKTKLLHLKIWLFGDKELEKEGKMLPCKKCNTMFKSYTHYVGGWNMVYDAFCLKCRKK